MAGDEGPCETPMSDHVRSFWNLLETEHVQIQVNLRRETSAMVYWDGASFGNDVAKALVADRARLTALEQENKRLREALEPFALVAEHDIGESESDADFYQRMDERHAVADPIRVGHLRRAAAALTHEDKT